MPTRHQKPLQDACLLQYSPKIMHTQILAQKVVALQEEKMFCFCGLPTRTFEMQEVGSLIARSGKNL